MPQAWHVCIVQFPQRTEPHGGLFPKGKGKEAALTGVGGGTGRERVGDNRQWEPPQPSHLLHIYWESLLGGRRRLNIDGKQHLEIMEKVGATEYDIDQGRCGLSELVPYLLGGGSVGHALRVGDVGHDTANWEGFGWIPPQGGPQADREAT